MVIRIESPVIPENIEIYFPFGIFNLNKTNFSAEVSSSMHTREISTFITRDGESMEWMFIYYKDTHQPVPREVWEPIMGRLIDTGFDVIVYTEGEIRGLNYLWYLNPHVEVAAVSTK